MCSYLIRKKTDSPIFYALCTSVALFVFSCFWRGWDWYISESHAAVISSAINQFNEIPYFSFFWNQGSYILQEPTAPPFSIVTPLTYLLPSGLALRAVIFILCFFGFLGCYTWLKKYFSEQSALIGATAWCLNLWTLIRIVSGNDFFIYGLLLPWILVFIENFLLKKTYLSSMKLAALLGFIFLAPSIHALIYLIIPTVTVWLLLQLRDVFKNSLKENFKLAYMTLMTFFLVALFCLPKIISILRLPAVRAIPPDFDLKFPGLILGALLPIYAGHRPFEWWGDYGADTSQVSLLFTMQLMIIFSLFSFSGFKATFFKLDLRLRWFIGITFLSTIILIYSHPIIALLNSHSTVSLRVLWRFSMIFSISFAVIAALAWENLIPKFQSWFRVFYVLNLICIFFVFVPYYSKPLHRDNNQYLNPIIYSGLFKTSAEPNQTIRAMRSSNVFSDITSHWTRYNVESINEGYALIGLPHLTGNSCYKEVMYGHACLAYADRIYKRIGPPASEVSFCSGDCEFLKVTHHSLEISSLKKEGTVDLLLKIPDLGFVIPTVNGSIQVTPNDPDSFKLHWNFLETPNENIQIQVVPIVKSIEWIIWIIFLVIFLMTYLVLYSYKKAKSRL